MLSPYIYNELECSITTVDLLCGQTKCTST